MDKIEYSTPTTLGRHGDLRTMLDTFRKSPFLPSDVPSEEKHDFRVIYDVCRRYTEYTCNTLTTAMSLTLIITFDTYKWGIEIQMKFCIHSILWTTISSELEKARFLTFDELKTKIERFQKSENVQF